MGGTQSNNRASLESSNPSKTSDNPNSSAGSSNRIAANDSPNNPATFASFMGNRNTPALETKEGSVGSLPTQSSQGALNTIAASNSSSSNSSSAGTSHSTLAHTNSQMSNTPETKRRKSHGQDLVFACTVFAWLMAIASIAVTAVEVLQVPFEATTPIAFGQLSAAFVIQIVYILLVKTWAKDEFGQPLKTPLIPDAIKPLLVVGMILFAAGAALFHFQLNTDKADALVAGNYYVVSSVAIQVLAFIGFCFLGLAGFLKPRAPMLTALHVERNDLRTAKAMYRAELTEKYQMNQERELSDMRDEEDEGRDSFGEYPPSASMNRVNVNRPPAQSSPRGTVPARRPRRTRFGLPTFGGTRNSNSSSFNSRPQPQDESPHIPVVMGMPYSPSRNSANDRRRPSPRPSNRRQLSNGSLGSTNSNQTALTAYAVSALSGAEPLDKALARLAKMHADGILTENEFSQAKELVFNERRQLADGNNQGRSSGRNRRRPSTGAPPVSGSAVVRDPVAYQLGLAATLSRLQTELEDLKRRGQKSDQSRLANIERQMNRIAHQRVASSNRPLAEETVNMIRSELQAMVRQATTTEEGAMAMNQRVNRTAGRTTEDYSSDADSEVGSTSSRRFSGLSRGWITGRQQTNGKGGGSSKKQKKTRTQGSISSAAGLFNARTGSQESLNILGDDELEDFFNSDLGLGFSFGGEDDAQMSDENQENRGGKIVKSEKGGKKGGKGKGSKGVRGGIEGNGGSIGSLGRGSGGGSNRFSGRMILGYNVNFITQVWQIYYRNERKNLQCFPYCSQFGEYSIGKLSRKKHPSVKGGSNCPGSVTVELTEIGGGMRPVPYQDIVAIGRITAYLAPSILDTATKIGKTIDTDNLLAMQAAGNFQKGLHKKKTDETDKGVSFEFTPKDGKWMYPHRLPTTSTAVHQKFAFEVLVFVHVRAMASRGPFDANVDVDPKSDLYVLLSKSYSAQFNIASTKSLARQVIKNNKLALEGGGADDGGSKDKRGRGRDGKDERGRDRSRSRDEKPRRKSVHGSKSKSKRDDGRSKVTEHKKQTANPGRQPEKGSSDVDYTLGETSEEEGSDEGSEDWGPGEYDETE